MHKINQIIIITLQSFLFVLELPSTSSISPTDGSDPVSHFLFNLIHKKFPNCTVITLEDDSSINSGNHHHIILNEKIVVGKVLLKLGNSTTIFPEGLQVQPSNTRKYNSQCKLGVIFLSQVDLQVVAQVRDLIAPMFMPFMRKDEDHYVFVTRPGYHESLLLMKQLPHRVKFKIAVGLEEPKMGDDGSLLSVSTIDFFGGVNGSPQLIHFSTEDKDMEYFPDFLWDLKGAVIQIVLPETKAFVEPDLSKEINNGKRGRWLYLFDEYLVQRFNFTYHMFVSTDINGTPGFGATGFRLKNGTWIGMTGDLLYGRADLGLAFANTEKRSHFISFTDQFFDIGCLTFVTGQPVEIFSTTAILDPFHISTWGGIIGSSIAGMAFIVLAKSYLKRLSSDLNYLSFASQVRILLAPFIEQDYVEPSSVPLRCFIAFWSFFAIVVTTLYRSKLVTLLAFPAVGKLPETFEELAFTPDFKIGFMKHGDSAYNTLKASSEPVYVTLVKNMEIIKGDGLECLKNVVTHERYGCIAYDFDLVYLHERNLTDVESRKFVIATRGRTYNVWLGLGTEAYSKFRVNFGKVLGWTMPFHLAIVWDKLDMYKNVRLVKMKWWKESNQMDKLLDSGNSNGEEPTDELNLDHIRGVFYIYFGCVLISGVAFIVELVMIRYKKRKGGNNSE